MQYSRWLKFASEASGPQKTKKRLGGNFKFSGCGLLKQFKVSSSCFTFSKLMSISLRLSYLSSGFSTSGRLSGSWTKTELKASARTSALSAGQLVLEPSLLSSVGIPVLSCLKSFITQIAIKSFTISF